jgi:cell division protein FtsZ
MKPPIVWEESQESREKFLVIGAGESGSRLLRRMEDDAVASAGFFTASDPAKITQERLSGADMVFVVADMEKETDIHIVSAVAERAKKMEKLTVGVVQIPGFSTAKKAAAKIGENLDALLTVASDGAQDKSIGQIISGIVSLANSASRSTIVVDFIDVKTVLKDAKTAIFTSGSAKGENSAAEAARAALRRVRLPCGAKAKRLLFRFHTREDFGISELQEAASIIFDVLGCESTTSIWGHMTDDKTEDSVQVSILAAELTSDIVSLKNNSPCHHRLSIEKLEKGALNGI